MKKILIPVFVLLFSTPAIAQEKELKDTFVTIAFDYAVCANVLTQAITCLDDVNNDDAVSLKKTFMRYSLKYMSMTYDAFSAAEISTEEGKNLINEATSFTNSLTNNSCGFGMSTQEFLQSKYGAALDMCQNIMESNQEYLNNKFGSK